MILHTVNNSPFSRFSLKDCLTQISDNDYLLLLEDAVIAVSASFELTTQLKALDENNQLFVLSEDVRARALKPQLGKLVDFNDFVDLAIKCKSQLAW